MKNIFLVILLSVFMFDSVLAVGEVGLGISPSRVRVTFNDNQAEVTIPVQIVNSGDRDLLVSVSSSDINITANDFSISRCSCEGFYNPIYCINKTSPILSNIIIQNPKRSINGLVINFTGRNTNASQVNVIIQMVIDIKYEGATTTPFFPTTTISSSSSSYTPKPEEKKTVIIINNSLDGVVNQTNITEEITVTTLEQPQDLILVDNHVEEQNPAMFILLIIIIAVIIVSIFFLVRRRSIAKKELYKQGFRLNFL
jgi:hypothetical protein